MAKKTKKAAVVDVQNDGEFTLLTPEKSGCYLIYQRDRMVCCLDASWNSQAKQLAEFIVKACNAHQDLLGALKEMRTAHDQLMPGIRHIAVQDYANINDAPIAADRAIAKVEGRIDRPTDSTESDDANREMGLPEGEDWGNK